jgi:hypothetical protein
MGNISSTSGAMGTPQPEAHATGSDSAENIFWSLITLLMASPGVSPRGGRRRRCLGL